MAELVNCKKCGRMFSSIAGEKLCSRCRTNDEDDFKIVREYIYDNPGARVQEVAEETGVSEKKILKFLREGKLELKGEGVGYPCASCGKSIKTGRFCEECQRELKQGFTKAFNLDKKDNDTETTTSIGKQRMHTVNKNK